MHYLVIPEYESPLAWVINTILFDLSIVLIENFDHSLLQKNMTLKYYPIF